MLRPHSSLLWGKSILFLWENHGREDLPQSVCARKVQQYWLQKTLGLCQQTKGMSTKRSASYYTNGRFALIVANRHRAQLSKPACSVHCHFACCALDLNSQTGIFILRLYIYSLTSFRRLKDTVQHYLQTTVSISMYFT